MIAPIIPSLPNPKSQQSFGWLFYIGLALLLMSFQGYSAVGEMSQAIWKIQFVLGRMGLGLLVLRLLLLAPSCPAFVLGSFCLMAVFKFFIAALADPGGVRLYTIVLVAAASRGAAPRISLRVYLAYLLLFLILCPLFYAVGWAGNVVKHIGPLQGGSFGFCNPNTLATFLTMSVFLGLYLSRCKQPGVIWIVCWAAAVISFLLTLSRTSTVILLAMPVFYLLFRRKGPRPGFLAALPVVCLAASVLLMCLCSPGYGTNTFESRFSIAALVYEKFGLSLFGQNCGLEGWFKGGYPYHLDLDNGFLNLFLCTGVVPGIVAMIFLVHLFFLLGKKGDALLSAIACCILVSGLMEKSLFNAFHSFLPLVYVPLVGECAPESERRIISASFAFTLAAALYAFLPWYPRFDSPKSYGIVADIPCPSGFIPEKYGDDGFPGYIEALPLARPDSVVTGYNGMPRDSLVRFCYQVVDFPLIDKDEQCADVCMRLRAEYLYQERRFRKIRFADTRGRVLRYHFLACRPIFEHYLKEVFKWSNTESMCLSMPVRPVGELAPGDVFVYDKESRMGEKYGHAVMVAKVAVNPSTSQKAVLLIQGSTPACDVHVVANPDAPDLSPWHILQDQPAPSPAPVLSFGKTIFYSQDLRYFNEQTPPAWGRRCR